MKQKVQLHGHSPSVVGAVVVQNALDPGVMTMPRQGK